jgi:hypothetical protein
MRPPPERAMQVVLQIDQIEPAEVRWPWRGSCCHKATGEVDPNPRRLLPVGSIVMLT